MTEEQRDFVYTQEWLDAKLQRDRELQEKEEARVVDERAREFIREAYKRETGAEPTQAQVEATLAEKRRLDVAEAARRNEAHASAAIRRNF